MEYCERTTDKLVIQTWVFKRHFLENKWSKPMALRRKHWQYFFAEDKMWVFKQNLEFWKTGICHCELESFLFSKDISVENWLTDVIFFFRYCMMKCVNIWKNYKTQWTNILQMTNVWCTKPSLDESFIQSARSTNKVWRVSEMKNFENSSTCPNLRLVVEATPRRPDLIYTMLLAWKQVLLHIVLHPCCGILSFSLTSQGLCFICRNKIMIL